MIIRHIIRTLQQEDSTYINDLGFFEKKFVTAQLKEGVLMPPHYAVFFTPENDGNGFAFIAKLSETEQIRFNEADTEIKKWINELRSGLTHNKSIHFDNFGTFSLNAKNDITFDSDIIKELNVEYEGMGPITITPIKEVPITLDPIIPENEHTTPPQVSIPVEEKTITVDTTEDSQETEITSPIKEKKKRKVALIITMVLLVLLLIPAGYYSYMHRIAIELTIKDWKHKYFDKNVISTLRNAEEVPTSPLFPQEEEIVTPTTPYIIGYQPIIEDNTTEEIILSEEQTGTSVSTTPNSSNNDKPSSSSGFSKVQFEKGNYYVIAGSFYKESDALKHIQTNQLEKLNPTLLYQEGVRNIRVCIGTYNSEGEAMEYANSFHNNYWVLK